MGISPLARGPPNVWLDRVAIHTLPGPGPLDEVQLASVLGPVVDPVRSAITVVVDGRAPTAFGGATATYLLLAALELRRGAPLATTTASPARAVAVLEAAVLLLARSELALVVAGAARADASGYVVAACVAGNGPAGPNSIRVADVSCAAKPRYDDGFLDLLGAATPSFAGPTRRHSA